METMGKIQNSTWVFGETRISSFESIVKLILFSEDLGENTVKAYFEKFGGA